MENRGSVGNVGHVEGSADRTSTVVQSTSPGNPIFVGSNRGARGNGPSILSGLNLFSRTGEEPLPCPMSKQATLENSRLRAILTLTSFVVRTGDQLVADQELSGSLRCTLPNACPMIESSGIVATGSCRSNPVFERDARYSASVPSRPPTQTRTNNRRIRLYGISQLYLQLG
jgi:hypothetical protein